MHWVILEIWNTAGITVSLREAVGKDAPQTPGTSPRGPANQLSLAGWPEILGSVSP